MFAPDASHSGSVSVLLEDPNGTPAAVTVSGPGALSLYVPTAAASIGNTFSAGTFVTGGILVVASPLGLPAGSSLFVGANPASLLADPTQNTIPITRLLDSSANSSGGGTASPPSLAAVGSSRPAWMPPCRPSRT